MQNKTTKTRQRGVRWWLVRLATAVLFLIIILGALTWVSGASAKSGMAAQNPPPGQLIDVDGTKLHIHCQGSGSATVVMDAGLNDFSLFWTAVQPEIAQFSRVCVYDRAGLGWSEASSQPRTSQQMVHELHTLLQNADLAAPYLLVGHSFGGVNMRLFAQQYPAEVAGLVLVDSSHEEMFDRSPEAFETATTEAISQFGSLASMSQMGLLALSPESIPDHGLSGEALAQYRAILATTDYFKTAVAESESFAESLAQVRQADIDLGDLPVIVISHGVPDPFPGMSDAEAAAFEELWQAWQRDLLTLSANSKQIVAGESGHYIQLQQPDLVVTAVGELISSTHLQE